MLIIAAGVIAYHTSLHGEFVFDDRPSIVTNENIRHIWPLAVSMRTAPQMPLAARPIVSLSFAINYAIGGLNVTGYHIWNITVHIICGLLIYGIVRRTVNNNGIALVSALLFIVHPLNSEVVNYTMQRTESMMAMFALLTLYCFIRRWYILAMAACALGMGCKEVMAVVPFLVLAYDRIFIAKTWREVKWKVHAGIFATLAVMAYLQIGSPRSATSNFSTEILTPWNYFKTEMGVLVYYLRLVFWPHPLVADYYDWPLATTFGPIFWQFCIILALLGTTVSLLRRRSAIGYVGLMFFLVLAPTSSFIPLHGEFAAERRMYLPLAALLPLIVVVAHALLRRMLPEKLIIPMGAALTAIAIGGLTFACVARNEDYRTGLSLFGDVVKKRPNNARGWANYAAALSDDKKPEESLAAGLKSVELDPGFFPPQRLVAKALSKRGEHEWALRHFIQAVRLQHESHDPDEADTRRAIAMEYVYAGKIPEALQWFNLALQLDGNDAAFRDEYGYRLASVGRIDEAMKQFDAALGINPTLADAHYNRALILNMRGQTLQAIAEFRRAIELDSKRFEIMAKLAWILAVNPNPAVRNPADALMFAEKAAKLAQGKDAEVLDTLAAAFAQVGRFDDATRTAEQAQAIAAKTGNSSLAAAIRQRQQLYKARNVYIQSGPPGPTTRGVADGN